EVGEPGPVVVRRRLARVAQPVDEEDDQARVRRRLEDPRPRRPVAVLVHGEGRRGGVPPAGGEYEREKQESPPHRALGLRFEPLVVARRLSGPGWNRTTARSFEGSRSVL